MLLKTGHTLTTIQAEVHRNIQKYTEVHCMIGRAHSVFSSHQVNQLLMRNDAGNKILLHHDDYAQDSSQNDTMEKSAANNQAFFAGQSGR